jgi:hypothetical protein
LLTHKFFSFVFLFFCFFFVIYFDFFETSTHHTTPNTPVWMSVFFFPKLANPETQKLRMEFRTHTLKRLNLWWTHFKLSDAAV